MMNRDTKRRDVFINPKGTGNWRFDPFFSSFCLLPSSAHGGQFDLGGKFDALFWLIGG